MEKVQGVPPLYPPATAYVEPPQYTPTAPPGAPPPYPQPVAQVLPPTLAPTTIQVVQPRIVLGSQPAQTVCHNCHQGIVTTTVNSSGTCVLLSACFILICCWPLFWVPLVIDSCKDVEHLCPACGVQLGVYKRL